MGLKFQHFLYFILFWHFKKKFSILEVEIGRNGPGILGVNLLKWILPHNSFFFQISLCLLYVNFKSL
jgi:hypothetical protein